VGPRAGMDMVWKRKIPSPQPGIERSNIRSSSL